MIYLDKQMKKSEINSSMFMMVVEDHEKLFEYLLLAIGARMESEQLLQYKSLVNEVTKGMEKVKKLKDSSSTNQETVLERMLSSYEEALSILNGGASEEQCESIVSSVFDVPASSVSSVWETTQAGELSSGQPKPKGRKRFPTFTEQVSVTQSELDDGYAWRKYGQKGVLGSRYPRSYYRCAHRHDRGCLATKQVQMSDDNSAVYDVTYRGKHTCSRIEPVAPQVLTEKESVTRSESTSVDDGYSWRKYGEKLILGSEYPRSYYRCTHKSDQGCKALKQVQMSDDNPSVYDITYKGKHTCSRIQPGAPEVAVDAHLGKMPLITLDQSQLGGHYL